jgi:integrase
MLHVYTRHRRSCEHRGDVYWRRCRCPKWLRGLLLNGQKIRRTARTSNWENAEKLARKLEADVDSDRAKSESRRELTLRQAVQTFMGDQKARGLAKESPNKYRTLLERQLLVWADAHRIKLLSRIGPADLTKFRTTWGNGEATTHRKHEMLMSFFKFCQRNEFMVKNPMEALRKPKTPDLVPTDYFRREEFDKIVDATYLYDFGGGNDCHDRGFTVAGINFAYALVGAGHSRRDQDGAGPLSKNDEGDDQIFLYRAKTGVPVHIVIPPEVADLLRSLPNSNPRYFFWSGNGDPRSARKAFQRSFWKLFNLANLRREDGSRKRCHPYMFRDTFAVELLLAGNPIDQVSLLLGHSSVKITERHYAHAHVFGVVHQPTTDPHLRLRVH